MTTRKKKTRPPQMDSVFPIEAGYKLPPVEHGQGREIMQNESPLLLAMSYRSFYVMWEHAERTAAEMYPKYVGGPMDHVAQTWLDAVVAFRSAAAGKEIRRFPEAKAQRAREILAKIEAREKAEPSGEAAEQPQEPRKRPAKRRQKAKA